MSKEKLSRNAIVMIATSGTKFAGACPDASIGLKCQGVRRRHVAFRGAAHDNTSQARALSMGCNAHQRPELDNIDAARVPLGARLASEGKHG